MPTTMRLIAKVVLGADASSIGFTNIPGTFTDLLLVTSTRMSNTGSTASLWINGSNASQSSRYLYGNGSAAGSGTSTDIGIQGNISTMTASTFASGETYFPNYAGSTNKSWSSTMVQESNSASNVYSYAAAGLWSSTSAITSLSLNGVAPSTNLVAGSSAFLYGITKA